MTPKKGRDEERPSSGTDFYVMSFNDVKWLEDSAQFKGLQRLSGSGNFNIMPPTDVIPTTQLFVLLEGTPTPFVVDVQRGMNLNVSQLTIDLCCMPTSPPLLQNARVDTVELWKVDIDLEIYRNSTALSTLKAVASGSRMEVWDIISHLWPRQPSSSKLSIIVKVLMEGIATVEKSRPLKRLLDLAEGLVSLDCIIKFTLTKNSSVQEDQAKRHRSGEVPSGVCKSAKSMQKAQEYAEILNGRPWDISGPPVGLFHPIFDQFMNDFNDPSPNYRTASPGDADDSMPSTDEAFSFMRASSEFYEDERSGKDGEPGRMEAILPALRSLLGVDLLRVKNVDQTEPDAQVTTPTSIEGIDGLSTVVELKLESGVGGDAGVQAERSYGRTCSLSKYEPIRSRSCCPCFLVGISGPWITVFGAVYVQKVIVQHLVGPLYLSPQMLHPTMIVDQALRLFYALRKSLRRLRDYYSRLPLLATTSRLFPYAESYVDPTSTIIMNLDYSTLLSTESRAVYLAKVDDRHVVVKFVLTYSIRAHHLLAETGLAPEIIYDGTDGPRYGGLSMIVMEYVKGNTLTQFLQSSPSPERLDVVLVSVRAAIKLLHTEGLVFGDLRTPNILVDGAGHVKIIDFDWAGADGTHRYPFIVGDGIEWAKGVGPLAIMYKSHDLFMLEKMEEHIRRGDDPGVW